MAGSLVLGRLFGLFGIAAGAVVAALLTSSWYLPRLVAGRFHKPFGLLVRHEGRRLTLLAFLMVPLAIAGREISGLIGDLIGALLGAASVLVIGTAAIWIMTLDHSVRTRIVEGLRLVRASVRDREKDRTF